MKKENKNKIYRQVPVITMTYSVTIIKTSIFLRVKTKKDRPV